MILGLRHVTLFVSDLDESRKFYEGIGLSVVQASPNFILLNLGDVQLGLHVGGQSDQHQQLVKLHIGVTDVEQIYEELRDRGYEFMEPLKREPWGLTAVLRDPDGVLVEFVKAN